MHYISKSEPLKGGDSNFSYGHAARHLTNSDYDAYDLLIGMDSANLKNMYRICGGDYAGKMSLLMDHTDHPGDVADPWYTGNFEAT